MDLVLDHVDRLPDATVVAAAAAPYSGFRDQSVLPLPLDYHRIEDFIERYPAYVPGLLRELKPGSGYCTISSAEVDEAVRGLTSPHVLVRQHATCVLGDRGLGRGIAKRVLPLLGGLIEHDPDADVRRLAILSLLWWGKDSRHYADTVRKALTDPASAVRATASQWPQEQGLNATA